MDHGDGLEDDYVPDDNLVADEDDGAVSIEDDDGEEFNGVEDSPATGSGSRPAQTAAEDSAKAAKKRKRREKEKEKKAKKRRLLDIAGPIESHSPADQAPDALAEYMHSSQTKTFSKLSSVELEDIRIPESAFADTTAWTSPRTLDCISDFIGKVVPVLKTRLAQKPKDNGAPTLLFISGGALRVADVTRTFKSTTLRGEKGGDVAKLFARHFKLEEHVQYVKRTRIGVAVGTPGRIGKLLCDTDAISITALTHIVLDISFQDAKKRTLLDIPETRDEVFKLVFGSEKIKDGIRRGKIQIVLF